MPRARLTAALLCSALLVTGAPLLSQEDFEEEFSESSEDVEFSDEIAFGEDDADDDDWDDSLGDDAVDVEDGGDQSADAFQFIDDDDVAFDEDDVFDLDDDGNDDPDDAFTMFQDKLPRIEYAFADIEGGDLDEEARARPGTAPFGSIVGRVELNNRINGWSVKSGQAKFQAQIRYTQDPRDWRPKKLARELPGPDTSDWEAKHICGGALIGKDWVITAAHCLTEGHVQRGIEVMLGDHDIANPNGDEVFEVERVVFHEGYYDPAWNKRDMYRNDIALIKLKPDPRLGSSRKFEAIPLYTRPLPNTDVFLSTLGWGVSDKVRDDLQNAGAAKLFRADVKLINNTECAGREGFGAWQAGNGPAVRRINDAVVCGGDTASKACKGDSGGPVIFTNGEPVLVAIVSWTKGKACGVRSAPGVYTRIGSYAGWIRQVISSPAGTVGRSVRGG